MKHFWPEFTHKTLKGSITSLEIFIFMVLGANKSKNFIYHWKTNIGPQFGMAFYPLLQDINLSQIFLWPKWSFMELIPGFEQGLGLVGQPCGRIHVKPDVHLRAGAVGVGRGIRDLESKS
jgi:hypothetical protein